MKKLREEPIYIAPEIIGLINSNGPSVFDEHTGSEHDPYYVNDKTFIYERQIQD